MHAQARMLITNRCLGILLAILCVLTTIGILIGLWYVGNTTSDGDEWHDPTWSPAYVAFYIFVCLVSVIAMVIGVIASFKTYFWKR